MLSRIITPKIRMPSANEAIYLNVIPKDSQWKQGKMIIQLFLLAIS